MTNINIEETEENGRYEARASSLGKSFSVVVFRSPISGWPYDYKRLAHAEIRAALAAESSIKIIKKEKLS